MRTGALVLVSALAFASVPARAEDHHRDPIRSLYRAVAALNARVSKLEGNIEPADLAGTYGFVAYGSGLQALVMNPVSPVSVAQNASISHFVVSGTATLNADGTGSIDLAVSGFSLTQGAWTVTPATFGSSGDLVWTYANGVVGVTLEDGEHINLNVGPGGRLLAGVQSQSHDAETDIIILTRL